jgi:hypothetical protein
MANWKKFKKFVQKVAKPVALVASVAFPALIPALGTAIAGAGASAAVVAATGAAALSAGASVVAGDKPSDVLKNAALAGITAGTISKVSGAATAAADSAAAAGSNTSSAYYTSPSSVAASPAGYMSPDLISAAGGATNLGVSAVGAAAPAVGAAAPAATSTAGGLMGSTLPATAGTGAAMADVGIFDKLAGYGSSVLDFAKANPSLAGSLLGALGGAIDAKNAPKEQTTTTSIDPDVKREYMANLDRAKAAAAGLGVREFAQPGAMYTAAEQNLYNLGMTPFGAADIQQFFNPYEEQVVQGALGDIERSRLMQDVADRARARQAGAFGGSRQAVQSALTNEAALRQASSTASGLRQTGFTQAANLGLAARPLNIAGLQTSMGLGAQRDALTQARLDAQRNIELERLGITSGALGLQPARTGETSTQPLYTSGIGSALSGGLTGAYIGSLLQPKQQPVPRG